MIHPEQKIVLTFENLKELALGGSIVVYSPIDSPVIEQDSLMIEIRIQDGITFGVIRQAINEAEREKMQEDARLDALES